MKESSEDRRLVSRHNISIPLKYRLWRSELHSELGRSLNISEAGVYFATRSKIETGQLIEVRLKMPWEVANEAPTEWLCTGQVVRVDRAGSVYGIGVRFDCYEVARPLGTTTMHAAASLRAEYPVL
jgi:PilZ domain-containing protein